MVPRSWYCTYMGSRLCWEGGRCVRCVHVMERGCAGVHVCALCACVGGACGVHVWEVNTRVCMYLSHVHTLLMRTYVHANLCDI